MNGDPAAPLGLAPPPVAADVGVVAALPVEVGYLIDRLSGVRTYAGSVGSVVEGEYKGVVVAVVTGGMGRSAARRACQRLLDGHRPRWVVSAGFAGALNPGLKRNDLVFPAEVIDPEGNVYPTGADLPLSVLQTKPRLIAGRLVTVDSVVATAGDKGALRAESAADVVDMETSAVAAVCRERSVGFLSVRVVSDDAETEIPPEALDLVKRKGTNLVGAALRAAWNRPSCVKELLTLQAQANRAADRLADATLRAVELLTS